MNDQQPASKRGRQRGSTADLLGQGCLFTVIDFIALAVAAAFAACGGISLWAYLGTLLVLSAWLWFVFARRRVPGSRQAGDLDGEQG